MRSRQGMKKRLSKLLTWYVGLKGSFGIVYILVIDIWVKHLILNV